MGKIKLKKKDKVWVKSIGVEGVINLIQDGQCHILFRWPVKVDAFERWNWYFSVKNLCLIGRSI